MKKENLAKKYNSAAFAKKYHYSGDDLGAVYTPSSTTFRVWAPTAIDVDLLLYQSGHKKEQPRVVAMKDDVKGTWLVTVAGDLHGQYYTYRVLHDRKQEPKEACDPYAVSTGANGRRAAILDMHKTDPRNWADDSKPDFGHETEAVIYEAHVRDLTIHATSGAKAKGKYIGLAEKGLKTKDAIKTGLDHIVEMGATHLHLLPIADFASVDETKKTGQYNWGYDPMNYNVPEGWYATDPCDGSVRVNEFKQMVQGLHQAGLRVVLDVVYNHTYRTSDSNLNAIVPGYYYRQNSDGEFSNGSACGNETASDRSMVRKFMVDSIVHWATEYHVDGFRFDLMGLHDLDTMRAIRKAVDKIDSSIILYGEGWTGGDSPCPYNKRAMKTNVARLDRIAAFNDTIRDAIKGHVAKPKDGGFVQGNTSYDEKLRIGITASVRHKQITYPKGDQWEGHWAKEPFQCVSYNSCHDNHTLWDKINLTTPGLKESERVAMNKLAAAIVMTSQGIAFLHAGEEFARTKHGEENSYNLPDKFNAIDWRRKKKYLDLCEYYKGLIALRKKHPAFRLQTADLIRRNLAFLPMPAAGMVGYCIHGEDAGDPAEWLVVIFNATGERQRVGLPDAGWKVHADEKTAGTKILGRIKEDTCEVAPRSALILTKA